MIRPYEAQADPGTAVRRVSAPKRLIHVPICYVVLLDSVRRVAYSSWRSRPTRRVVRTPAVPGPTAARKPAAPSLLPGQLRRTRPDLPLIDAVDGFSDFVQCHQPGCCALRPVTDTGDCPICHKR